MYIPGLQSSKLSLGRELMDSWMRSSHAGMPAKMDSELVGALSSVRLFTALKSSSSAVAIPTPNHVEYATAIWVVTYRLEPIISYAPPITRPHVLGS